MYDRPSFALASCNVTHQAEYDLSLIILQGITFSAMLGDMLEAVRWPQDLPPAPSSPFSRGGASKGGKPESPSAGRVRVPVGQIGTSTLAAHPTRQLFLTGTHACTAALYCCLAVLVNVFGGQHVNSSCLQSQCMLFTHASTKRGRLAVVPVCATLLACCSWSQLKGISAVRGVASVQPLMMSRT